MAEKTAKAPNYTAEMTAEMVKAYTEAPTKETVEMLAKKLGRQTRSVIAKLSREGVYKKQEYVGKTGEKPAKKDDLASKLGALVGLTEAEETSLEKVNKTALVKLLAMAEAFKSEQAE